MFRSFFPKFFVISLSITLIPTNFSSAAVQTSSAITLNKSNLASPNPQTKSSPSYISLSDNVVKKSWFSPDGIVEKINQVSNADMEETFSHIPEQMLRVNRYIKDLGLNNDVTLGLDYDLDTINDFLRAFNGLEKNLVNAFNQLGYEINFTNMDSPEQLYKFGGFGIGFELVRLHFLESEEVSSDLDGGEVEKKTIQGFFHFGSNTSMILASLEEGVKRYDLRELEGRPQFTSKFDPNAETPLNLTVSDQPEVAKKQKSKYLYSWHNDFTRLSSVNEVILDQFVRKKDFKVRYSPSVFSKAMQILLDGGFIADIVDKQTAEILQTVFKAAKGDFVSLSLEESLVESMQEKYLILAGSPDVVAEFKEYYEVKINERAAMDQELARRNHEIVSLNEKSEQYVDSLKDKNYFKLSEESEMLSHLIENIDVDQFDQPEEKGRLKNIVETFMNAIPLIHEAIISNEIKGKSGDTNESGDEVHDLDIILNQIIRSELFDRRSIKMFASEEQTGFSFSIEGEAYLVFTDPLDGSSNMDKNFPVGTFLSIYKVDNIENDKLRYFIKKYPDQDVGDQDDLEAVNYGMDVFRGVNLGEPEVAMGIGHAYRNKSVVLATTKYDNGAHLYTNDHDGNYYLLRENVTYNDDDIFDYFAIAGNYRSNPAFLRSLISDFQSGTINSYSGAMISDVISGFYMYSSQVVESNGELIFKPKLRKHYEGLPSAVIARKMGGSSLTFTKDGGIIPIDKHLHVDDIHYKMPIFIGPKEPIQKVFEAVLNGLSEFYSYDAFVILLRTAFNESKTGILQEEFGIQNVDSYFFKWIGAVDQNSLEAYSKRLENDYEDLFRYGKIMISKTGLEKHLPDKVMKDGLTKINVQEWQRAYIREAKQFTSTPFFDQITGLYKAA